MSEALGHSTISITLDTYSHVTPTLQREAAHAMGAALFGSARTRGQMHAAPYDEAMSVGAASRRSLVRRAIWLECSIIAYNCVEGVLSVIAGILAGSITLVGFGFDSAIEVSAAVVVVYHLRRSREEMQPAWERKVAVFVGLTLLVLSAYVAARAVFDLATRSEAAESWLGVGITAASVVVMPVVSRMQRRLAQQINSMALMADSKETLVCTYLSATALVGLALNALFGWWWADPIASLLMVVLIVREGREILTTRELLCVD